jgi:hypothetical protein
MFTAIAAANGIAMARNPAMIMRTLRTIDQPTDALGKVVLAVTLIPHLFLFSFIQSPTLRGIGHHRTPSVSGIILVGMLPVLAY